MDKKTPSYLLADILSQMTTPERMNMTTLAIRGMRELEMEPDDVFEVVRGLTHVNFYKSMTTRANHRIWQDVYHAKWLDKEIYLKFQFDPVTKYFLIQFKDKDDGY